MNRRIQKNIYRFAIFHAKVKSLFSFLCTHTSGRDGIQEMDFTHLKLQNNMTNIG